MFQRIYIVLEDAKISSTVLFGLRFCEFTKNMENRASLLELRPSHEVHAFVIFRVLFSESPPVIMTHADIQEGRNISIIKTASILTFAREPYNF
jgi:hypothetical protein